MKSRLFRSTSIKTIYFLTCSRTFSELFCVVHSWLICTFQLSEFEITRRGNKVVELYSAVTAFQKKLQFFLGQRDSEVFHHFPELDHIFSTSNSKVCPEYGPEIIKGRIKEFGQSAGFLQNHVPRFDLMTNPMTYLLKDL
jgi:hypothetical protein